VRASPIIVSNPRTLSLKSALILSASFTVHCAQAPQPVEPWGDDVIRDALEFGASCPQMIFESDNSLDPRDEDCLHLNVYSPYRVSDARSVEHWSAAASGHRRKRCSGSGARSDRSWSGGYRVSE